MATVARLRDEVVQTASDLTIAFGTEPAVDAHVTAWSDAAARLDKVLAIGADSEHVDIQSALAKVVKVRASVRDQNVSTTLDLSVFALEGIVRVLASLPGNPTITEDFRRPPPYDVTDEAVTDEALAGDPTILES